MADNSQIPFPKYSFVFDFERRDVSIAASWMQKNWTLSLFFSVCYLLLIQVAQRVVTKGFQLKWSLFLWNFALALFSVFGAVRMLPELVNSLWHRGFLFTVCNAEFYAREVTGFWGEMFVWSKLVEFGDTLFLLLRARPVSFIHWYHHISVLIFTWHGAKDQIAASRWFINMNYFVHSLMYSYYALRTVFKRAPPKSVAMMLTTIQILQMFQGLVVVCAVCYGKWIGMSCDHPSDNLYLGFAIYITYSMLFMNFFYGTYLKSRRHRKVIGINGENHKKLD